MLVSRKVLKRAQDEGAGARPNAARVNIKKKATNYEHNQLDMGPSPAIKTLRCASFTLAFVAS